MEYGNARQLRAAESFVFTRLAGPEAEARLLGRRNSVGASQQAPQWRNTRIEFPWRGRWQKLTSR
jgi:hypothetical protein